MGLGSGKGGLQMAPSLPKEGSVLLTSRTQILEHRDARSMRVPMGF